MFRKTINCVPFLASESSESLNASSLKESLDSQDNIESSSMTSEKSVKSVKEREYTIKNEAIDDKETTNILEKNQSEADKNEERKLSSNSSPNILESFFKRKRKSNINEQISTREAEGIRENVKRFKKNILMNKSTLSVATDKNTRENEKSNVNNISTAFVSIDSKVQKIMNVNNDTNIQLKNIVLQMNKQTVQLKNIALQMIEQTNVLKQIKTSVVKNIDKNDVVSNEDRTVLKDASDEYVENMVNQMREEMFGITGEYIFESKELKNFLNNYEVKDMAVSLIKDTGKFCKFLADILIPQEILLKYYFPTKKRKINKDILLDDTIVECFNISAKYLGLGIIEEEKTYLSHGYKLLNLRSYDKTKRNINVTFYSLSSNTTFFSKEQLERK